MAFQKNTSKKTIELGCNKYNIGYIFRKRFLEAIKNTIPYPPQPGTETSYVFVEKVLNDAKNEMKKEVIEWMKQLGCEGKGGNLTSQEG